MFYACVQRFDGMDEKILGGELNRALEYPISVTLIVSGGVWNCSASRFSAPLYVFSQTVLAPRT